MKKLCFTLSLVLSGFLIFGQIIPVKNNFQAELAKVIADYPDQFSNLLGELLLENPQSTDYRSLLSVPGAEECTITKYSSAGKAVYSWQATMLRTDNFNAAAKKFNSLFSSINNLSVTLAGARIVFKGTNIKPVEGKKFYSAVFLPATENAELKKIRVEHLMEAEMLDWTLKLLVYEKEREDDESGKTIEQ